MTIDLVFFVGVTIKSGRVVLDQVAKTALDKVRSENYEQNRSELLKSHFLKFFLQIKINFITSYQFCALQGVRDTCVRQDPFWKGRISGMFRSESTYPKWIRDVIDLHAGSTPKGQKLMYFKPDCDIF
jgi:hypothetical protein